MSDDAAWPEAYEPNWAALQEAEQEAPFNEAAFYIFREASELLSNLSATRHRFVKTDRNAAIRMGLCVKLTKLSRIILSDRSEDLFQQLSVFRQYLDVASSVAYLCDDSDGSRHESFILNGLVSEREQIRVIEENIKKRGKELPIETRMKRSIGRTLRLAGVNDPASIPGRSQNQWPSAEERMEVLGGREVYGAFRAASSEIHGDWTELLRDHLVVQDDGSFDPNHEPQHERPQVPIAASLIGSVVCEMYSNATLTPSVANQVRGWLDGFQDRALRLDQLHEAWLQSASN